ncbi:MAG: hypothetical protein AAGD14_13060 [Planctomycetota bacterium]
MRGSLLLVLAGAAVFAAALRFRTAVHPEEITDPAAYASFARASEQLPALNSVRVHTTATDAGSRLRRARTWSGFRVITDVEEVDRQLLRGTLASWEADRLRDLARALERGELPDGIEEQLPRPADVRPFFVDGEGPFQFEVFLREDRDVDAIQDALPEARLFGEPVLRAQEEERRRRLQQAAIAALLAVLAWNLFVRRKPDAEQRVLALAAPLALLGWHFGGLDAWTIPALALVATARHGMPLLAGALLLFLEPPALQRMGLVFLVGGLVRLPWSFDRPELTGRLRIAVALPLLIVPYIWLQPLFEPDRFDVREPLATWDFDPSDEVAKAGGRVWTWPETEATLGDVERKRHLRRIFARAQREAARAEDPVERALLARIRDASARDAVALPPGLRRRARTKEGEQVYWMDRDVRTKGRPASFSSESYRRRADARFDRLLQWATGLVVVAAVVLIYLAWGLPVALLLLIYVVAGLALVSGVPRPLLPVAVLGACTAGWGLLLPVGIAALLLGTEFALAAAPLLVAPPLAALVARRRERDQSLISMTDSSSSSSSDGA